MKEDLLRYLEGELLNSDYESEYPYYDVRPCLFVAAKPNSQLFGWSFAAICSSTMEVFHAMILAILATAVHAQKELARIEEYFRRHPQREPLNAYPQPDDSSYDDELEELQNGLLRSLDRGDFEDKGEVARMKENLLRYFEREFINPSYSREKELLDEVQGQLDQEWERMNARRRSPRKA
ncbi:unnamed protein product [Haemonchus placei]|uniref:TGFb_propeptide domain-containing protein n=1 Tax=Haemonchus placei TaxID=6290 RepID=A0A0N4WIW9_HAEPC|nr:unnamed protein product [Haemonchus placei]